MIAKSLPDATKHSMQVPVLTDNKVVFARTHGPYFYPEHFTPFVFLTNFTNKGSYFFNRRSITLSDTSFLLSKPHDTLSINFGNAPLDTLLILFEEKFFTGAYSYYQASEKEILDSPSVPLKDTPFFPGVPFESDNEIRRMLMNLVSTSCSQDRLNELLFEIIGKVSHQTETVKIRISKMNAVKEATRVELYRRLHKAKEFMIDNSSDSLRIDEIAREACLNKFHFIATFKDLYNVTPNQYLMNIRMEKAYRLLKGGGMTVSDVCRLVGYESLGSFSNAFRKKFSISPSLVK